MEGDIDERYPKATCGKWNGWMGRTNVGRLITTITKGLLCSGHRLIAGGGALRMGWRRLYRPSHYPVPALSGRPQ